jgi:hypothetical protein
MEHLGECQICGEAVYDDNAAEMYDPKEDKPESKLVHPECGLQRGWEVA